MSSSFRKRYAIYLLTVFLLPGTFLSASQGTDQKTDSVYSRKTFTGEELIRGERLFYGLAYPSDRSVNCSGCHNTQVSDTLNWNPDALVISKLYANKGALDLSKVLLAPSGTKMMQVHKNFQLTPEDITLIKAFMDRFVTIGLKPDKPVITNLLLFILATGLFLFSMTDLVIIKRLKRRWVHYAIVGITAVFIIRTLVVDAIRLGRTQDYSPDQPVKFSHAVHAGQNRTDCIYCHSFAKISKTAGIPPVNVCMNCHILVRNGTRSGTFEIAKIISSSENKVPMEWVKVYNLPDYVFFSHAQHTGAGNLDCSECHGNTKEMDRIIQVSDLSMGWCIDCHRTRIVNFKSNKFFTEYRKMTENVRSGRIDSVTVNMMGGTECMKCHY